MKIQEFIKSVEEPFPDSNYGEGYRCSAYLNDGLYLPCVIIRRNKQYVDLACRRFEEEKKGRGIFKSNKNGYRDIVKTFVATGNRVNEYDIKSVEISRFALPLSLLSKIKGETVMGWTGFVFEMMDGKMFSFGSSFLFSFFELPDGYDFNDVVKVHNHAFISEDGKLISIKGMSDFEKQYTPSKVYRERPYFECYID
jgi:hypothetical protein